MRVVLSAFGYGVAGESAADVAARAREIVAQAVELGFDGLASGHHLLTGARPVLQPVPLLASLAGDSPDGFELVVTQILSLAQPVRLAEDLSTLSALNGGGVSLLAVLGYAHHEFAALGIDRRTRVARFEQNCAVLRELWSGRPVTSEGHFGALVDASASPAPEPGIDILVGADADAGVRRAARLGNGWAMASHLGREELVAKQAVYEQERLRAGADGPVPPLTRRPLSRLVYVAPTDEEAIETARPLLAERWNIYAGIEQQAEMDDPDEFLRAARDEREGRFLVGSPEYVAAELRAYRDALGIDLLSAITALPGLPGSLRRRSTELLAGEVLPAVGA